MIDKDYLCSDEYYDAYSSLSCITNKNIIHYLNLEDISQPEKQIEFKCDHSLDFNALEYLEISAPIPDKWYSFCANNIYEGYSFDLDYYNDKNFLSESDDFYKTIISGNRLKYIKLYSVNIFNEKNHDFFGSTKKNV